MTKLQAQYKDLKKALKRLKEALKQKATEMNRDASIQRFEFTFEMSWKLMQSIAKNNNINLYGVKSIIREAAKLNLIDNPIEWFDFLEKRNQTAHTYKKEVAKEIYSTIKKFPNLVNKLIKDTKAHIN
ncbi:MAG: HI0074 family nucleotidyltransferase substrate-binding subunit [Candidatus Beckwithbacteria bacterium]|nr:nucleotidyltransferase substrate binding protein [Patescibacteria group bacterium]